ncbi:MAG: glycosyltransferase family 4 protein [Bdellovibrionales bacterium]|jgi:hypothetical protein|nr:glycosyltransferase family 4 protein [Bdellovibrionales bacterium]
MTKNELFQLSHILIICPKKDWDLTSQWAYDICVSLLNTGHQVTLLCKKSSFLYKKLKNEPINFIFQRGIISFKVWHWRQFDSLIETVAKKKVHLIHCFDLHFIWPLFFFLRKFPQIPLLHFQGTNVSEKYNRIWHKIIKRRVDHIFVPDKRNADYLHLQFNIPYRKMTNIGLPPEPSFNNEKDFFHHLDWSLALKGDALKVDHILIGVEVAGSSKVEDVTAVLRVLTLLRNENFFKRPFILFFASKRDWKENLLHGSLPRLASETDFRHDIVFYPSQNLKTLIREMDIWITMDEKSYLNESVVHAIESSVAVMAPKSEFLLSLGQRWPHLICGYQVGDGRELYLGLKRLSANQQKIGQLACLERGQISVILGQYEKSLKKRGRLVKAHHL